MSRRSTIVNDMLYNVCEFLSHHPLTHTDDASVDEWKKDCVSSWETIAPLLSEPEQIYGNEILSSLLDSSTDLYRLIATKRHESEHNWSQADRNRTIQTLLHLPQVEQRTANWYAEAANIISASQFSTILKSGRTRGQLVLDKATGNVDTSTRRTVVLTMELNPFTWGIRFEPVVKQLYSALTGTLLAELGRLRHRSDTKLAASPDGLVVEGPPQRLGRFVEFKAPVSRPIQNTIPSDYLIQMQIQMEVGQVEECDYFEVKFHSDYGQTVSMRDKPDDAKFWGRIFVIGDEETGELKRYEYSPLQDMQWMPTILGEGEAIVESVPWWTSQWFMVTVGRSRSWFASVQPAIESFWKDVHDARNGQYQLPEPTRKRKQADPKCLINEDLGEMVEVE
jgi:hypothetical protein